MQLATEPDVDAVSFRRLGQVLGVHPTAVYRHFRDKDALVLALLDRLTLDVLQRVPVEGLAWRPRLRVGAIAYLDALVEHPAIGHQIGFRASGGPGELGAIEFLLVCLQEAGLDDVQVVRHYALTSSYVLAMASAQASAVLSSGRVTAPGDRSWLGALVEQLTPVEAYPTVTRLRSQLAALRDREVFLTGLDLILDGIEAAAHR